MNLTRLLMAVACSLGLAWPAAAQTTYTFNPTGGPYTWGNASFWTPGGGPPDAAGDIARFNSSTGGAFSVGLDNDYTITALQYGPNQTSSVNLSFVSPTIRALSLTPGAGANGATAANNGLTTLYVQSGSGNHSTGANTRLLLGGPAGSSHVWDIQDGSTYTMTGEIRASASTNVLTKVGGGTLVFAGNSGNSPASTLFLGGLFVNQGTVLANAPGFSNGVAPITVNAGGTLGGSGGINLFAGTGFVTVAANGVLTAGTSATATTLTITGGTGLQLDANSTLAIRLLGTGPTAMSRVTVNGDVNVDTNELTLNLAGITPAQAQQMRNDVGAGNTRSYTVLSTIGELSGSGFDAAGFSIVNNSSFFAGEFSFGSFDTENGLVTVNFTPVPESRAAVGVAGIGFGLATLLRRRRAVVG